MRVSIPGARCAILLLCLLVPATRALGQEVVGAVGAANSSAIGHAPGHAARSLAPGGAVFFKDRIVTSHGGSAQIAFLDRSTLNVGENSDVLIDDFVYKPGSDADTMSATLTKGVLRFVGGQISHGAGATVKTPTVTIGIRGGIATIGFLDSAEQARSIPGLPAGFQGGAVVINGFGTMTVRNQVSEMVVTRPGFAIFVGGAGEPIAAPIQLDAGVAQAMMARIASKPTQHGGLPARSVATTPSTPDNRAFHLPLPAPQAPRVDALRFTAVVGIGNALSRDHSQTAKSVQVAQQLASPATASSLTIVTHGGVVVSQGSAAVAQGSSAFNFLAFIEALIGHAIEDYDHGH